MLDVTYIKNGIYKLNENDISSDLISKIEHLFGLLYHDIKVIDFSFSHINVETGKFEHFYSNGVAGDWEHFRLDFLESLDKIDWQNHIGLICDLLVKVDEP